MAIETKVRPIWKDLPQLSLEERDRRWGKIRHKMALQGLDGLIIFSMRTMYHGGTTNLRYVTHLDSAGYVLFPLQGEPIVFPGVIHLGEYAPVSQNWVKEVRPRPSPEALVAGVKEIGLERGNLGIVGFGSVQSRLAPDVVPYRAYTKIQESLPGARFSDATGILEEVRLVKSEEEVRFLEKAADLAYLMYEAMVEAARPGNMECQVVAAMIQANVANGGEEDHILLDVGSPPLLHGRYEPTTHLLEKGDIIVVEYHSRYAGYLIAVEHSVSLGEPSKEFQEIHKVSEECFYRGIEKLRPGVLFSEVVEAFRAPADEAGMAYVELGIHGHGLSSPEFPTTVFGGRGGIWHEHGLAKVPNVMLEENMVFGTNIDLHNPNWRKDTGLMVGDTMLVTRNGPRKMTRVPLEFTVVK
jgi:Xaa-Pro aminopeptidase